jgi:hypothetical protein
MTPEEKAKEYSNSKGLYNEHGERLLYMGYLAGYKEVARWRDPKEVLPTAGEPVIVKYRTAKNVEKHGIGKYFNLGIGNPWTIEGSTGREVIGWRPIE